MEFAQSLEEFLLKEVRMPQVEGFENHKDLVCISLLEVETNFLATMDQADMDALRRVTEIVTDIVWLTGFNRLDTCSDADKALAHGFSRALMLEQPSLRLSVMDIGNFVRFGYNTNRRSTCLNISRVMVSKHDMDDKEFVQKDGLLYISRFVPDDELNTSFRKRLRTSTQEQPPDSDQLRNIVPARLIIQKPGLYNTLSFEEMREPPKELDIGFIDVSVKAIALNAKDVYTLAGRVETSNGATAHEFAGVVEKIGPGVRTLVPGDRVLVMAPSYFSTNIRVPAWAAQKLLPHEDFATMASLPTAYTTALYALHDRASLKPGETILIHAGSGAFGTAAIKIAQSIGAIVYTTVSTQAKKDFVTGLGVPESHIFQSRDATFAGDLLEATCGRGVDVIINSLVGDLLHDSWRCIANFGRFVEIGKRDLADAGKLDMRMFLRNTTYTAFDISDLYFNEHNNHRDILLR